MTGYAGYPLITLAPSLFLLVPAAVRGQAGILNYRLCFSFFFYFFFFISHFPFFLSLSSFLILYHPVPNGISTSIPLFTFYNLPLSQLSSLSIVIGWFSFPPADPVALIQLP